MFSIHLSSLPENLSSRNISYYCAIRSVRQSVCGLQTEDRNGDDAAGKEGSNDCVKELDHAK